MSCPLIKQCSKCGFEKPLLEFSRLAKSKDGHRPSCKQCDKKARDPIKLSIHNMAKGILERTNPNNQFGKNVNYKGVERRLGNAHNDVYEYLCDNFKDDVERLIKEGKSPSIDRINSQGHYEHGNLRVIDLQVNSALGLANAYKITSKAVKVIFPNGDIVEYKSISEASREISYKRDTIIECLKKERLTKAGIRFERI